MICKECGAPLKPGAKFCTKCGAEVEKEPIVLTCPECGRQVSADQKFCRFCGCTLDFSENEEPQIPDIPVIPQPQTKETSFFESEVKPMKEKPREEVKQPDTKQKNQNNWPAFISLGAAAIGFLSPLRWVVNIVVGVVIRLFRLYYFYPILRFISFMYGFMHWVCILLCLAVIAGLSYLLSVEKSENQSSIWMGFIPAACSLISVIFTMTMHPALSFLVSIPAILVGILLANKVFIKREVLRGPFDLNSELDSLKGFFASSKPKSAPAATVKRPVKTSVPLVPNERLNEASYFDGNGKDLFVISLVNALAMSVTCGIMIPWAQVRVARYEAGHTVYNGRRLQFVGKTSDLFILYLKWILLSMVTCGIYFPFAMVEYTKWISRYTGYEDETPGPNGFAGSDFDGNAFEYYGYTSLGGALTALTCGIGSGWYFNLLKNWTLSHTKVCHDRMAYDKDTWTSTLGILLVNYLLTSVTCGIYGPWARCRINEYAISRTHINPNYNYHE
ncbi:MAG: DUF898 family protein [Faecalicoccus sp.]|nr:DUF898 family protein [Faecalicoccus sp.]